MGCRLCGQSGEIKYTSDDLGPVSVRCEASDEGMWARLRNDRSISRDRKRNAMHNISKRLKITDRVEFPQEGTCLLDGRFYYYSQKRKARVKGTQKCYQMRGFAHFVKVFGERSD